MIPALLGLSGKLKTLIDRLTATRAALLDNLNSAVSTRAPASTALTSATWTSGLASILGSAVRVVRADVVAASGSTGAGAGRKTADITITSVTVGKTAVFVGGGGRVGTSEGRAMAFLTSATNIRLHYVNPNGSNNTYKFQVVVLALA